MSDSLLPLNVWDGVAHRGMRRISWSAGVITAVDSAEGDEDAALSLIPGLIDTHVHLIGNASDTPADFLGWPVVTRPEEQVLHGLSHAQRALRAGTTTVRDLAADDIQFSLQRALEAEIVEGPRLVTGGMLSMTGGHGDMFTPPAVENRRATADGPWQCRALVRRWARSGADGIKIATSGGVLSGDQNAWRNHTDEEIAAIVDEAHALGMWVAAHAHTEEGIDRALRLGVDSIEHATRLDGVLGDRAAAQGVTVAPTLLINDRIASGAVAVSPEQQRKAREIVAARDAGLRSAAESGVEFVLGTDANGYHVGFDEQMLEVRRMAEVLGYSPERVLRAATSAAADVVGLGDRIGRIAPGFAADFLVMSGRPWLQGDDLRVENIVAVVARGRLVHGRLPAA